MASPFRISRREAVGGAGLALAVAAAAAGWAPAATLLQPLAGSFFVLLADGLLKRRRGRSPFASEPQAAVWMAILSIFLWTGVEALNAERGLWAYVGWPSSELLRYAALGWFFATILPAMALMAEWIAGDAAWRDRREPSRLGTAVGLALYGAAGWAPLPADDARLLAGGVLALYLIGGGPAQSARRTAAWAAAGWIWILATQALDPVAQGQRILVHPEGFPAILWPAATLLGPALGGLYQRAAQAAGQPAWPSREGSPRLDLAG
ncbi:MAG: hypothetical protein GC160_10955 [Acidobacteria bacterium]|nr:hypothetical protein [Acidobacteriota bacterium]